MYAWSHCRALKHHHGKQKASSMKWRGSVLASQDAHASAQVDFEGHELLCSGRLAACCGSVPFKLHNKFNFRTSL